MHVRLAAAFFLSLLAAAHTQSRAQSPIQNPVRNQACVDQLRATDAMLTAAGQTGTRHAVSARLLGVSPKAWQHYQRAAAAIAQNKPELAETEAAKALALAPTFAEVYLLRALEAAHTSHPADALPLLAAARALAPELPWVGIATAGTLNQLGRFDQARTELASVPGVETDSWQALYERARAATGLRDLQAALHWSELAVAASPAGCTEVRLLRANVLTLAGRSEEVITELEAFLAEDRLGTRRAQVEAVLEKLRSTPQPGSAVKAQVDDSHGLLAMN